MPQKPTPFKIEIGARLREMRVGLGMSQGRFAKLIGTSSSGLANWESGFHEPDLEKLRKAKPIGLSFDFIIANDFAGLAEDVKLKIIGIRAGETEVEPQADLELVPILRAKSRRRAKRGSA